MIMAGEYRENEQEFSRKFKLFASLLKQSRKTAVFTGAGVSTLSGIPDFRGSHGVYNSPWNGLSVEEILSIDYFYSHPEIFYAWAEEVWYHLEDYEPNIVHYTLAELEHRGLLQNGLFTQNIDFMHQRAGSRRVYELHGSAKAAYCTNCNAYYTYDTIAPIVREGKVPRCTTCGSLIKPDIVFYGESLSSSVLKQAEISFSQADLTLIMGSSLTVYPAAAFPELTNFYGGKTVIVNAQPTSQDSKAEVTFRDLEQFSSALKEYLEKNGSCTVLLES